MPKHLPTFKHLISSSFATPKPADRPDKSVNQLIASSRSAERPPIREAPPHHAASTATPAVWVPGAGDVSVLVACGMMGEAPVHPAELLRRAELARRRAARSVAGPVPPPSWRFSIRVSELSKAATEASTSSPPVERNVTKQDLIRARSLFDRFTATSRRSGVASLVEHCLGAVLLYLESSEEVYEDEGDGGMTIGEAMREQVGYLDPHLKVALLDAASIRPESSGPTMSDASTSSILRRPEEVHDAYSQSSLEPDDWATIPAAPPDIHHLSIILHPNPLPLLRSLPSLPSLSLMSLNLAFSTIKDLERLVTALPGGLRELGLVGVRFARIGRGEEDVWKKGLALLGRKMIVLRMLDLSYPSISITAAAMSALHTPERTQIPSLVLLGLRGIAGLDLSPGLVSMGRRRWIKVIRNEADLA